MENLNKLLKAEILDRFNFRCKHRHNGLTHPSCYEKEKGGGERIGFLDIESGGSLDADWGVVLSYAIKPLDGKIIHAMIKPKDILNKNVRDKHLLEQFCKDVWKFDTLVVYYGRDAGGRYQRHDIPFLRTRAAKWGVEGFPRWHEMKVVDVYDIIRGKFKLSRRKLIDACRLFGFKNNAQPFNVDIWLDALQGKQYALNYVLFDHNDHDVIALEEVWKRVIQYRETRGRL